MSAPDCMECGKRAVEVGGDVIYPHRPDLHHKRFWRCDCGAYCGCHDGTSQPLGFPCGPETRKARLAAHAALDPLWKAKIAREGISKKMARGAGYKWLAKKMGLPYRDCHISMMTKEQASEVVRHCKEREPA